MARAQKTKTRLTDEARINYSVRERRRLLRIPVMRRRRLGLGLGLGSRERKCSQRCDRLIIEQARRLVLGASSSLAFLTRYPLTKNRGFTNNCNDGQLWGEI